MWTYHTYDELYHHGILGQKWGVSNGPPYPLGSGGRSGAEKKHTGSTSKYTGTSVKAVKSRSSSSSSTKSKGLTDKQKTAIKVGAIATAAVLAAVGTTYLVKSGVISPKQISSSLTKQLETSAVKGITNELEQYGVKLIKGAESDANFKEPLEETLKWANRNSLGFVEGRHHNCLSCAFSTELRMRGYDVVAKEMGSNDRYTMKALNVFGRLSKINSSTTNELEQELLSQGNNSRGIIMGFFKDTEEGAHFMNYSVSNGEINLIDGQAGERYTISEVFGNEGGDGIYDIAKTRLLRTDNVGFNSEEIMNYVEANDGMRYNFSNRQVTKWLENGLPDSVSKPEQVGNRTLWSIKRSYYYVKDEGY